MNSIRLALLGAFGCLFLLSNMGQAQSATVLVGSGSTVPAPLYTRWSAEYGKRSATLQMRYLPVGTTEGIKQISHSAGDFAAGEAQLSEKERKDDNLVELPIVLIAIVPIYNVPDVHQELRLSGDVLAGIFLGEIRNWNAPQIVKLNPDANLPGLPIQVINRPAGKGSNYVFTDFLSKANARFKSQIGTTASPKWPVGDPAERSSDMADRVKNTPGAIGYVEYQYAEKNSIAQAAVLNPAGKFVKASAETLTAACQTIESPRWNNFAASLTNAPGADAFPITSFTWIYLHNTSAGSRTYALSDLLNWIYSDGQHFAGQEGYTELPAPLLAAVRKKVKELQ
ncbi:MAG TPA: phosphate ABC transporter substrate-binding protein PstS [Candidatus Binatia bacterium]|nr:phosphate ABC transporter substrate-binding protein PstS [Candidatus Binatia bacterium]